MVRQIATKSCSRQEWQIINSTQPNQSLRQRSQLQTFGESLFKFQVRQFSPPFYCQSDERETRTRVCRDFLFRNFDASNNCFCTVSPPSCPLLQKRLVKLATTINATVTATSLNFLSIMPNNLGGKRSDTTIPKKGR